MKNQITKFIKEEKGQGMTEYGLILGVIAVGVVGVLFTFGDTLTEKVTEVTTSLTNQFTR